MSNRLKKDLWVSRRQPRMLKGKALNPNAATEARYYAALHRMIRSMVDTTHSELRKLYEKPVAQVYFAQDDTMSAQAKLVMAKLMQKFQAIFDLGAPPLAAAMTGAETKASSAALQQSLGQIAGGMTLKTDFLTGDLKDIIAATIQENVQLIKSMPQKYFTEVQGEVMRSIATGRGEADLLPFLQKQTGITLRRAQIIARDQTRKAFANINFERMKKLGITEYQWLHSAGGQKPRKLHQRMSGNIYRMDNPPIIDEKTGQRGKPGDLINCRCRMVPIIKFNEGDEN